MTGTEYKPTDCVVRSHQKITCLTVPGIGSALFWHVTVREQSNALTATTSYAAPYINSMTPAGGVSADGSDLRDFLVYLNVSDSGLKDPLSNIVIQMDVACKLTLNTCGPYEIPIEPFGATSTRQEGEFDILAFRVPMLKNQKDAHNIAVSLVVYPSDRDTGNDVRTAAVSSSNVMWLSYAAPRIEQIVVTEHPWINGMRILTVIGTNFGSIEIGDYPEESFAMRVNSIPVIGGGGNAVPISMQLGVDMSNPNRTSTYVQMWKRGAENERHDELRIVWSASENKRGAISITRGGVTSNIMEFEDLSPKIVSAKWERVLPNANPDLLDALPTLGSSKVNPLSSDEIQMELTCKDCGSPKQMCCRTARALSAISSATAGGVPKLVEIWLGSTQLPDSELVRCPIVAGKSVYDESAATWTYRCQIPPYQGRSVDTRVRFDGRWSNATFSRYRAPAIETLSSSVGGSQGNASDGFSGNQTLVSIDDSPPVLLVRTSGEKIKISGKDFGLPYAGDVTGFNRDYVLLTDTVTGTVRKIRPVIEQTPPHGGLSVDIPQGTSSNHVPWMSELDSFPWMCRVRRALLTKCRPARRRCSSLTGGRQS